MEKRYQIDEIQPTQDAIDRADDKRRQLASEIDTECPECGEEDPCFIDYFDRSLVVECDFCGHEAPLSDFLAHEV